MESIINPAKIVVVSREACIYCTKAKAFLADKGIAYEEVFMDPDQDDYFAKRDLLVESTGQKTFPFIFVGDAFVGGYTELVRAFDTLKLHDLCKKVGIDVPMDF